MRFARIAAPAVVLSTALLVATSSGSATATSATPRSAQGQTATSGQSLDAVRQRVERLDQQVALAAQELAFAQALVRQQEKLVAELQIEIDAAAARLDSAQDRVGRLAAASYQKGALDPTLLQVVLANDPDAVLTHASFMGRLNHRQAVVVNRARQARAVLRAKEARLAQELTTLERARATAQARSQQITAERAAAQVLLAKLQEQERQRIEAARQAAARAAAIRQAQVASRSAARQGLTSAVRVSGNCPASGSRGAERGLKPNALRIMRCGLASFPRISNALGLGHRGNATDHDDGRAVDFMIPNYRSGAGNDLGWAVAEWAVKQPGVTYVIFDQKIYSPGRGGWRSMENRGSDTANHRDHVHVSVK